MREDRSTRWHTPTRRGVLAGALATPALALAAEPDFSRRLAALERRSGGRLGVAVLDTGGVTGPLAYRGDERVALCSTWKVLATACVLARVDRGVEHLDRRIVFGKRDLVSYAPVTALHANGGGMTLRALCAAAMVVSDNTAANLLLDTGGGPPALTAYLRHLGDTVTRLDRREPDLNEVAPGDPRDTTTPRAMAETLHKLALGPALAPPSQRQLIAWLVACRTGTGRLRAGVPGWRVGDKTGTGPAGEANDVAIMWPAGRAPFVVTAYYTNRDATPDVRNGVLAEVGRLASRPRSG